MKGKRCIAFAHSDAKGRIILEELWTPCASPAERKSVLCRDHREALAGVFLGLLERPASDAPTAGGSDEDAFREALRLGARYFSNKYWQSRRKAVDSIGSPQVGSIAHD